MAFSKIDHDEAIIVERGVYRSTEVYQMDGALFVKAKGGFVRIKADGSTSTPNVRVHILMREGKLFKDTFGRLTIEGGHNRKPVMIAVEDDGGGFPQISFQEEKA